MKKETQNLDVASKKVNVIDNILAKKLVGGTGVGTGNEGVIAPCVHPVTPPPVVIIPGTRG